MLVKHDRSSNTVVMGFYSVKSGFMDRTGVVEEEAGRGENENRCVDRDEVQVLLHSSSTLMISLSSFYLPSLQCHIQLPRGAVQLPLA